MKGEFKENGPDSTTTHIIKMYLFLLAVCFNESYTLISMIPKIYFSPISPSVSSGSRVYRIMFKTRSLVSIFLAALKTPEFKSIQFSEHWVPFMRKYYSRDDNEWDMVPDLQELTVSKTVLTNTVISSHMWQFTFKLKWKIQCLRALATFQALSSHIWFLATMLDRVV